MPRRDGRAPDELRPLVLTRRYVKYAEGSVLVELGDTRVVCTASVEEKVPPFRRGTGQGWVTAEYGMLPRSTRERSPRDATTGRVGGASRKSSVSSGARSGPSWTWSGSARGPSGSTATSSRPTGGRARRPSRGPSSP